MQESRDRFLALMWVRAKKYRMKSCGSKQLDQIIKDKFGDWARSDYYNEIFIKKTLGQDYKNVRV